MLRHTIRLLVCSVLPLSLLACAHQPGKPAAEANPSSLAVAEANGVRVSAFVDEKAQAFRLQNQFTPIQVKIENQSGRTLRVAPYEFALTDQAGARYLPIVATAGKALRAEYGTLMTSAAYQHMVVYAPLTEPCGGQDRLTDTPYTTYSYTGPVPSGNVFPYAGSSATSGCPDELPTPQMARAALPEKPLRNGERAEGFVYYQAKGDRGAPAQLTMNLVDAVSGEPFGQAAVRFAANP